VDALTCAGPERAVAGWRDRCRSGAAAVRSVRCLVGLRLRAACGERLYLGALGVVVGVVGAERGLRGWVEAADRWTLLVDVSMTAAGLAGVVLAVSVTVNAWFAEAVHGWGRGLLATTVGPVRWWVAHALAAGVLALALAAVSAFAVLAASGSGELGPERLGRGGVAWGLFAVKLTAMTTLALAGSAFCRSPSAATLSGAGVLLVGHLHPLMRVLAEGDGIGAPGWGLARAVIPDLTAFDVGAEWIAAGAGPGPNAFAGAGEVGIVLMWGLAAVGRISRRD